MPYVLKKDTVRIGITVTCCGTALTTFTAALGRRHPNGRLTPVAKGDGHRQVLNSGKGTCEQRVVAITLVATCIGNFGVEA